MSELIAKDYDVVKKMTPRAEVIETFKARGEDYKLRLIADMDDDVTRMGLYHHQEYVDMCRGPHVTNTRFLKEFKLTRLRSEEHTSEIQSLMRSSYAGFCLKKKKSDNNTIAIR